MRRLIPWGGVALLLAACTIPPPASPEPPPATRPQNPAPPQAPAQPQSKVAAILFLTGPETLEAGQTATLKGRVLLPAGSHLDGLVAQAASPAPAPTPSSIFGGGYSPTPPSTTYDLQVSAKVPDPEAPLAPHDFSLPFTPPTAGTYHLQLNPRRLTIQVSGVRWTSGGLGRPNPTPSPMPEMWGELGPAEFPADEPVLGHPKLVERRITSVEGPASARVGQRVQLTARFWTNGLGKAAVDAYVEGGQVRVTGLSLPDPRGLIGPIPQQVEVPFSVVLPERRLYTVVSGKGEGSYATLNAY